MADRTYKVGVLGATGVVGSTILDVLEERDFPAEEVVPLASARSAGRKVKTPKGEAKVQEISEEAVDDLDLVLSSAGGSVSAEWAPTIVAAGGVVVDNTSFWRMYEKVPLVVSEVNPDALAVHQGIVANPNCTTMQMMVALSPLHEKAGMVRMVASSYQSVSGTGKAAIDELTEQTRVVLEGGEPAADVYPHPIAFNILPQVETFKGGDDYTTEERKVMGETRKILGLGDDVSISMTCARVPVITGHSVSVNLQTRDDLSPSDAREILSAAPGVVVLDSPATGMYPTPQIAAGRDEVFVGRIRRDPDQDNTLNMWIVGDNLRKGAALNAVQVAELLAEQDLIGDRSGS